MLDRMKQRVGVAIRRDLGYAPLVDPDLGMARAIADLKGL